jgi:hypothetical protein
MTMPELKKILAFRSKLTKLALSLIMIMDGAHKGKIIYNNIFPSNTLFHSPHDHVHRVNIGMCD